MKLFLRNMWKLSQWRDMMMMDYSMCMSTRTSLFTLLGWWWSFMLLNRISFKSTVRLNFNLTRTFFKRILLKILSLMDVWTGMCGVCVYILYAWKATQKRVFYLSLQIFLIEFYFQKLSKSLSTFCASRFH